MPGESGKKLFVGPRFRRIRQQLGLSQTQIAEGLGISPSYINLIERNQRPVTAQILLRLAETYDLDLRDLATADEDRFFAELNEIFSDPLFRQIDLPKQELRDLAELCPGVTHALQRLYAAYTEARRGETLVAAQMADREGSQFDANPIERVRDLIEANRNYFPELETAAENLRDELNVPTEGLFTALTTRLRERHSILTRVMPVDVMRETLRRFDRHRRQLLISELVDSSGRSFQLALQIGFVECGAAIDAIVSRAGPLDDTARRLYRITLANYFAAAAMMPYQAFHSAAEALSYDVHVLAQRFNAGFEQVCHRLTTLQRPNARGVPFFLLRVDNAGNVSKRFSSGTFPFSKFGGTCPLWNVHSTFDMPDRLLSQVIELPDGTRYFSIAQMVRRPVAPYPQPQPRFAIGLGCEIRHAAKLIYATGMDLEKVEGTPIGVNCRLCERENCSQRAEPPITRTLILDETTRRVSSFAFSNAREL
ncbi:putative transcriptional regulator/transcriptional regulator with XRE-family HTH domain [Bradyrhizobium japonicum]|uniref:Transcriptional regulator/transcriptional regulator with XRE-family HTH domain n=1 Tax=Bradyrhizobium elkanii TaxID=29448 RepID=A0ABV4F9C5_BRAEL|nr:short-chain fatty acyl-CoA regulator family protein [Bradyrhizobium elkanii]MBP2432885.1 putative transcriptional regulator/transcriptional regulator with XRE-family HTH domain [Bradyrhizobium elkanii]MCP1733798.1 putative transcriptional regulator/transcriptional regulator with XRE-family HTH domain [Bradyrhizobium elkanii]MCP1751481.1 putative transcriptional regulator/transcriptional regulator with XRE-family HTH domain [Bradyrhizobium elkanii]MCP1977252.1 putative transcriptional regulat